MIKNFFGISQNVFVLSLVSLLNDFAGETIKRTLPLFLVNIAGIGTGIVGIIEGAAESAATLIQAPVGRFSDITHRRKIFVLTGRLLQVCRVLLILPQTAFSVGLIRLADRAGKGLGTAPRDALLSDSATNNTQGRSFGFLRAADSVGAVLGLLIASAVIFYFDPKISVLTLPIFTVIVAIGAVPTILNVFLIAAFVREAPNHRADTPFFKFNLGKPFTVFLLISVLFTIGSFSEAFLILRAQSVGIPLYKVFLIIAAFSAVTSLVFLPAGILSDRLGRKKFLILGWLIGGFSLLGFGFASTWWHILVFYLVFGIHLGATEGISRAFIVDLVPADLKATAFGVYNTVVGATLFPASVIAGILWQTISPTTPFFLATFTSIAAAILLLFFREPQLMTPAKGWSASGGND